MIILIFLPIQFHWSDINNLIRWYSFLCNKYFNKIESYVLVFKELIEIYELPICSK